MSINVFEYIIKYILWNDYVVINTIISDHIKTIV